MPKPRPLIFVAALAAALHVSSQEISLPTSERYNLTVYPAHASSEPVGGWNLSLSSHPETSDDLIGRPGDFYDYGGYFLFRDFDRVDAEPFPFRLELPSPPSSYGGFGSFFDLASALTMQSAPGIYINPLTGMEDNFQAFWYRPAHSTSGYVIFSFAALRSLFVHSFELTPATEIRLPEAAPAPQLRGPKPAPGYTERPDPRKYPPESFFDEITIAWDPNQEPDIDRYNIYIAEEGRPPHRLSTVRPGAGLVRLLSGRTYTLYVTAVNHAGLESPPSETITYTVSAIRH